MMTARSTRAAPSASSWAGRSCDSAPTTATLVTCVGPAGDLGDADRDLRGRACRGRGTRRSRPRSSRRAWRAGSAARRAADAGRRPGGVVRDRRRVGGDRDAPLGQLGLAPHDAGQPGRADARARRARRPRTGRSGGLGGTASRRSTLSGGTNLSGMRYYESLVDLIGNTPLVKLNRVTVRAWHRPCWPRSSTSTPAAR